MKLCTKNNRLRGVVFVEACAAIVLVGMLLTLVSLVMSRYARSSDYAMNGRRAQLVAEGYVDRLRAGVLETVAATYTENERVEVRIEVEAAEPAWAPLRKVRVTAMVRGRHDRVARFTLTTFVTHAKGGGG